MNPEGWIVLFVGATTVAAQLWAAIKARDVATRQLEASEAALASELKSVLVVARNGYLAVAFARFSVQNGGRYPAIDLTLRFRDGGGNEIGVGRSPMVQPLSSQVVTAATGSAEIRDKLIACENVTATWSDGLGRRREELPVLPSE